MHGGNRFARRIFSFNKRNNTYAMALLSAGVRINTSNSQQTTISYLDYVLNY